MDFVHWWHHWEHLVEPRRGRRGGRWMWGECQSSSFSSTSSSSGRRVGLPSAYHWRCEMPWPPWSRTWWQWWEGWCTGSPGQSWHRPYGSRVGARTGNMEHQALVFLLTMWCSQISPHNRKLHPKREILTLWRRRVERQKLQQKEMQRWKEWMPMKKKVNSTLFCIDTDHVGGDLDTASEDNEEQPINSYQHYWERGEEYEGGLWGSHQLAKHLLRKN